MDEMAASPSLMQLSLSEGSQDLVQCDETLEREIYVSVEVDEESLAVIDLPSWSGLYLK